LNNLKRGGLVKRQQAEAGRDRQKGQRREEEGRSPYLVETIFRIVSEQLLATDINPMQTVLVCMPHSAFTQNHWKRKGEEK
jgi:hypothetical protein